MVGTKGKGDYVCGSDTVLGQGPVLSLRDQVDFGGFACGIQAGNSVRCHNKATGHGFSLSKKHKHLF